MRGASRGPEAQGRGLRHPAAVDGAGAPHWTTSRWFWGDCGLYLGTKPSLKRSGREERCESWRRQAYRKQPARVNPQHRKLFKEEKKKKTPHKSIASDGRSGGAATCCHPACLSAGSDSPPVISCCADTSSSYLMLPQVPPHPREQPSSWAPKGRERSCLPTYKPAASSGDSSGPARALPRDSFTDSHKQGLPKRRPGCLPQVTTPHYEQK